MGANAFFSLFAMVVTVFGMSHLSISDADKAKLAKKPWIHQTFVQFCRVSFIVLAVGSPRVIGRA